MENMEKGNLENKFCSYLKDLKIRYSKFDEVKQTMDDFCNRNKLKSKKVFTDYCVREIFDFCDFWVSITLDDAKKFLDEYLSDGKKISFLTLNSLIACMESKVCSLKELRGFIDTYVNQDKNHSEFDEEVTFLRNLELVVDLEKESQDESNAPVIKFFSDWQSEIIKNVDITRNNCLSVSSLAIKLLEFKTKTKQYLKVKDIRKDIMLYIKKIVLSFKPQNDLPDNILARYFNALLTASIGDKKYKQKVFDTKVIKRIKDKILGDDKKINNVYQMRFLIDILKLNYDLNRRSNLEEFTTKYQFDEAYNFIFAGQDKNEIKTIVSLIGDRGKKFIVEYFLSLIDLDSININSKSFRDFCEIFDLNIKEGQRSQPDITYKPLESLKSEAVEQTIKNYLSGHFVKQNEIKVDNVNKMYIENQYGSELHIQTDSGEEKICDLELCISKKDKQTLISCDINLSSYKKNSRAYEIFAAAAFLIFGFIPLIILKSIFDILFLPIKVIINIFHSAIIAFKRKEYLWKFPDFENETEGHLGMFLHILIDLLVGILFIAFSPIICLYNNFCGSKYLFHKSGTGQKLITFNNWYFYKEQSDSDRAKNFGLTEINLWFVIKYIFGFACLAKSEDSELKMEFKLTDNNQLSQESMTLKLHNTMLNKYAPSIFLTNEYSPLSYLESIK